MADQQPGGNAPAAGQPDPTRVEAHAEEPSTVDAPARWSGSAAVPLPAPKQSRWSRRRSALPADEPDDWATTPAVDPWAGHDTPWDPMPLPPEVLPPTRVEPPAVTMPPTRYATGPGTPRPPVTPPAVPPAAAAPPAAPRKRRWGRRRPAPATAPVNRVQVAARPYERPLPPPPPWHPPASRAPSRPPTARPLPPPPRRRRRWPRNLALVTLLGVVCCCGVPAYLVWPAGRHFPVSAALPPSVADLQLRDDAASRRAAERLSRELGSPEAFAGVYADGNGKRVTIFGVTGLRLTPEQDVEAQIAHLTAEYDIRDVERFDVGEPGVHERCGVGRAGKSSVVVCAWADHGSLATVLLTRRSVADSAELTGIIRSAVLTRG
jgi:hypothetical protein